MTWVWILRRFTPQDDDEAKAAARGRLSPPLFKKTIFVYKEFLRKQDDNQSNTPPTFTNISFILLLFGKGIP